MDKRSDFMPVIKKEEEIEIKKEDVPEKIVFMPVHNNESLQFNYLLPVFSNFLHLMYMNSFNQYSMEQYLLNFSAPTIFSQNKMQKIQNLSKENLENLNIYTNQLNISEIEFWKPDKYKFQYKGKKYQKNIKTLQLAAAKQERMIEIFEKIQFSYQFQNKRENFKNDFNFYEEDLKNHDDVFFNNLSLNFSKHCEDFNRRNEITKRICKKRKVIQFLKKRQIQKANQIF